MIFNLNNYYSLNRIYPIGKGWHLRVIGMRDATIQGDISLIKNLTIRLNICLDIPMKVQLSSLLLVTVLAIYLSSSS